MPLLKSHYLIYRKLQKVEVEFLIEYLFAIVFVLCSNEIFMKHVIILAYKKPTYIQYPISKQFQYNLSNTSILKNENWPIPIYIYFSECIYFFFTEVPKTA